jgi:hypothetical protein
MRISVEHALRMHGIENIEEIAFESVVPACCEEGCEVEPDGVCEHRHPSVLLALGII